MHDLVLFVASRTEIKNLLPRLDLQRQEEWHSVYLDRDTNATWIRFPLWDYHGPGPDCLRRDPISLEGILERIRTSTQDSEVAAAAYYLVTDFPRGKENLAPLLDALDEMMAGVRDPRRARNVALAVAWTHADRPFNHRDPTGKTLGEIEADYRHFADLAQRAATVRAAAEIIVRHPVDQKSTSFD